MMTNEQFDCCTTGASGRCSEAARFVLVEGRKVKEASEVFDLEESSIRNAMTRIRKRHKKNLSAYGGEEGKRVEASFIGMPEEDGRISKFEMNSLINARP